MTSPTITASIAVFKSNPVDYQKWRHTALSFKFSNPASAPVMVHIVGAPGLFTLQVVPNYDPIGSRTIAGIHTIGTLLRPISKDQLITFVSQTPIDNRSSEFNCQNWVHDALKRLKDAGYLTPTMFDEAFDEMMEITLQATYG